MPYITKNLIISETRDAVHEKRLSICLSADGFSFSEVSSRGELLSFGEAEGKRASQMTDVTRDIKLFFAEVGVRPMNYSKMELVVLSDSTAWVPDEMYNPANGRTYLKLVGATTMAVSAVECRELSSTAVFAVDDMPITAFKVALPGLAVTSQHIRMAGCGRLFGKQSGLLSHWRKDMVDLAAFRDGRYVYGGTLKVTDDDSMVYQLVEVLRVHDMEGDGTTLYMCGDVSRERYARYRPYFPKVSLFTGFCTMGSEFAQFHSYRHALLLV